MKDENRLMRLINRVSFARTVRFLTLALVVSMAASGFVIIYLDQPGNEPDSSLFAVGSVCPPGMKSTGVISAFGAAQATASRNEYTFDMHFRIDKLPVGDGRCSIVALVPYQSKDLRLHNMREGEAEFARVAVADIAKVSDEGWMGDIYLSFSSPKGAIRGAGLGEKEIDLGVFSVKYARIAGLRDDAVRNDSKILNLITICPRNFSFADYYPTDTVKLDSPDKAEWNPAVVAGAPPSVRAGYEQLTCEDPRVRFWVEHSTDLVVLGLGAILGVLVALQSRVKLADRMSRNAASEEKEEAPKMASNADGASMVRFLIVTLISIWILRRNQKKVRVDEHLT